MIYVSNAFSLSMVAPENLPLLQFVATIRPVLGGIEWTSCVGHADTASLLGVPCNRATVKLEPGDTMFIAQLVGPRLPEGTTVLPEGASFAWVKATFAGPVW